MRNPFAGERMTKADVVAGVPGAIAGVPDGMASGLLAGVSPVQGLYASMAGRFFGGFSTSTRLMVVTTTSASALAAGSALSEISPADRSAALVLLTLFAGIAMVVAAALRLGRYTRFVSHSVMTGFLLGIAVNIIFGQLPSLLGAPSEGSVAGMKALHVVLHPRGIDWRSAVVGVLAIVLMVAVARTRFKTVSSLAGLVVPTAVVLSFGWDEVATVADAGDIPTGFPLPQLPDFSVLSPSLITGALAVTVIVLVQGAGVAESAPNSDGSRARVDRDFTAQGIGNVFSALWRGMPVGGSVGQTAINTAAGGRTRWAGMWSGLWILVILVALTALVGQVPMPTLAAILIVAAVGSMNTGRVLAIWSSGTISWAALGVTFVATLLLPVTAAVGVGVGISLLLQLNQDAMDLKVVRLRVLDGHLVEATAPRRLADDEIVILDVYGSLFYAGARTLQTQLPDPTGTRDPVVILRLRGRTSVSATFLHVITDYARQLDAVGGRLYLSGVDLRVRAVWSDELLAGMGVRIEFFPATRTLGESTLAAYADAEVRIDRQQGRRAD
ncbi:SulP family inorganic anion transporter [Nocardia mangyaensis]|uniref:SulP family inorganic anion transporter n=1 Tax=Nocardia mangyaensis TaxID=2213200 RepID=UPI0026764396|nr:SulP family inorganic anion transporter [Nocardia mangyaensis]MDO3649871.1 SulP family inorganic anion transporter [Nocardia mangyaensis]